MFGWQQWNQSFGSMQAGGTMNTFGAGRSMGIMGTAGWAGLTQQAQQPYIMSALGRPEVGMAAMNPMSQGYGQGYAIGGGGEGFGRMTGGEPFPASNISKGKDLGVPESELGTGSKPTVEFSTLCDDKAPPDTSADKDLEPTKQMSAKDAQEEERLSKLKQQAKQWQVQQKKWQEFQEQVQLQQQAAYHQMNYQQQQQLIPPLMTQGNIPLTHYEQHSSLPEPKQLAHMTPWLAHQQETHSLVEAGNKNMPSLEQNKTISEQNKTISEQSIDSGSCGSQPTKPPEVVGQPIKPPAAVGQPPKEAPRAKISADDVDQTALAEFEKQLNAWNQQFELWREQNMNHPDRDAYYRYEKQWQAWRDQLVQRHAHMKHLCEEKRSASEMSRSTDAESHLPFKNPDKLLDRPETVLSKQPAGLNEPLTKPPQGSLKSQIAPESKGAPPSRGVDAAVEMGLHKLVGTASDQECVTQKPLLDDDMELDEPDSECEQPEANCHTSDSGMASRKEQYQDDHFINDEKYFAEQSGSHQLAQSPEFHHPTSENLEFEGRPMGVNLDFERVGRGTPLRHDSDFERPGRGRPLGPDPDFERLGCGRPLGPDPDFERLGRGRALGPNPDYERLGRGRPLGPEPDFERLGRGRPLGPDPDFERLGRGRPLGPDPDFERLGRGRPLGPDPDFERLGRGRPLGPDPDFERLGRGRPIGRDPDFERLGRGRPIGRDPDFERLGRGRPIGRDPDFERLGRGRPIGRDPDFERLGRGRSIGVNPDFDRLDRGHSLRMDPEFDHLGRGRRIGLNPDFQRLGRGRPICVEPDFDRVNRGLPVGRGSDFEPCGRGRPLSQDPDFDQIGPGRIGREPFFEDALAGGSHPNLFHSAGSRRGRGPSEMGPASFRNCPYEELPPRGRLAADEFGYDDVPGPNLNQPVFIEPHGAMHSHDRIFHSERFDSLAGRGADIEKRRGFPQCRGPNFDDKDEIDFGLLRRRPSINQARNQSTGGGVFRRDEHRGTSVCPDSDWDEMRDPFHRHNAPSDQKRALLERQLPFDGQHHEEPIFEWPGHPLDRGLDFNECQDSNTDRQHFNKFDSAEGRRGFTPEGHHGAQKLISQRKIPPLMSFEELEDQHQGTRDSDQLKSKPAESMDQIAMVNQKPVLTKTMAATQNLSQTNATATTQKHSLVKSPLTTQKLDSSKKAPLLEKSSSIIPPSSRQTNQIVSLAQKENTGNSPAPGKSVASAATKTPPSTTTAKAKPITAVSKDQAVSPSIKTSNEKFSFGRGSLLQANQGSPPPPVLQDFDTNSDKPVPVIDISDDEDFTADIDLSVAKDNWQSNPTLTLQSQKNDWATSDKVAVDPVLQAEDLSRRNIQSRLLQMADENKTGDSLPKSTQGAPTRPSLLGVRPTEPPAEVSHEKLPKLPYQPFGQHDLKGSNSIDGGIFPKATHSEPERPVPPRSPQETYDNGVFQYDDCYVFIDENEENLILHTKEWSAEDVPRQPLLSTPGFEGKNTNEEENCMKSFTSSSGTRPHPDGKQGPSPTRGESPTRDSRRSRGKLSRFSSGSPPRRSCSTWESDQPRRAPLLPLPANRKLASGFGPGKETVAREMVSDSAATSGKGSLPPLAVAGAITRMLTEEEQQILRRAAEELKALHDMKESQPSQKLAAEKIPRGATKWDLIYPEPSLWERDSSFKGDSDTREQSRTSYIEKYSAEKNSHWNRYGECGKWNDKILGVSRGADLDSERFYHDEESKLGSGTERSWERDLVDNDSWDKYSDQYIAVKREPEFRLSDSIITIDYGHKSSSAIQSLDLPKPEPLDYSHQPPIQPALILGKMETIDYGHGQKAAGINEPKGKMELLDSIRPSLRRSPPLQHNAATPPIQSQASPQIQSHLLPEVISQSSQPMTKERKPIQLVPRQVERKYVQERTHEKDRDRERVRERDRDRSRSSRDLERDHLKRRGDDLRENSSGIHREQKPRDYRPTFPIETSSLRGGKLSSSGKSELVLIEDLLNGSARRHRPARIVIILRGLPGSGKTFVAKLIKDKEVENGGNAPRMLCLDDYFMVDTEKTEHDKETGKKVKVKVLEYEYEPEMEESYRSSLFKSFKKTVEDGFFPFIIIDAINDKVKHFEEMWSFAKQKGFQVYIAEMDMDAPTCHKRNIHGRTLDEINKMMSKWESTPRHYLRVDVRSLLQDAAITEVEMEDLSEEGKSKNEEKADDVPPPLLPEKPQESPEVEILLVPSKWEKMEATEEKLAKLDGLKSMKRKREVPQSLEDYLQLPDDYEQRESQPGKKRVRWADIEESKDQERRRAVGFVVGQTDWQKITDPTHAQRALTRTKYI